MNKIDLIFQKTQKMYPTVFESLSLGVSDDVILGEHPNLTENTLIQLKSIIEQKMMSSIDVNKRFDILKALVDMVISGKRLALLITGEGGFGKSHTVMHRLRADENRKHLQAVEQQDDEGNIFHSNQLTVIKGYSTARGLYISLYNNRTGITVFDDCDDAWKNETSKNILKAALENNAEDRWISWQSNNENPNVPDNFKFEGRVIFISNLSQSRMDQALLTRCSKFELSMSKEEILTRMRTIMLEMKGDVSIEAKEECVQFLETSKFAKLSMRTLIETIDYRSAEEECNRHNVDWREIATQSLINY